jgi:hypothetical protein
MAQPVWNTNAGSLGTYPSGLLLVSQLSASPVLPASSIQYTLLSGSLPSGVSLSEDGLITGTPVLVVADSTSAFTVRATDNLNNIRDRTFSIRISGAAIPNFTTPAGVLLSTQDSYWIEFPIEYSNPSPSNPVVIELIEGALPLGLEINEGGIIRGYPEPPSVNITVSSVITSGTATSDSTNSITCLSTTGFLIGRPVVFTGTTFGDIQEGVTYYISTIENSTSFTIAATQGGSTFLLSNDTGFMTITLPAISVGQPTIRTYSFTLRLRSPLGGDTSSYSITVINQNTPTSQGGPGKPPNTRTPSILNTRPTTYNITSSDPYYGYYILPPVAPTVPAFIGTAQSGDYFAFKIIGNDFDGNELQYSFSGLPLTLVGDVNTGWITGTPTLTNIGISNYNFSVATYKTSNPGIASEYFNFSLTVSNQINGEITWITPTDLGTIFNGTISTLSVTAESDVDLSYRVTSGSLPPNLTLLSNGEITGYVADQPTDTFLYQNDTTNFEFTIQAYSTKYPIIESSKTFSVTVLQEFSQPTDILYIKAAPSIEDRQIISSLLDNNTLIPTSLLYRPSDDYFGKASSVIYEHAYGIYASSIDQYIAAVTKNHYWRNITLGELKTAVAKNSAGEVIYEVVYSEVIDNLVAPTTTTVNAGNFSIGKSYVIKYPGNTNWVSLGATNNTPGTIFTANGIGTGTGTATTVVSTTSINQEIYWPRLIDLGFGPWYTSVTNIYTSYNKDLSPGFYTSRTPGYARSLYPNSLYNMRNRVAQELGQEFDSRLLPLWMTSQQPNGSTLGYTQAWVICYTIPGASDSIKRNIETLWKDPMGNPYTLNLINFQIDRFTVNKSATYNYDNNITPPAWTGLPSATPVPDPLDSKDFYVLFPRQTILPNETQY